MPGENIDDHKISKDLNIKTEATQEILIQLASHNIVDYTPGIGFQVSEIGLNKKLETYIIIGILDALAATSAINNITDEDISNMKILVKKLDIAIKNKEIIKYFETNDMEGLENILKNNHWGVDRINMI